MSIGKTRSLLYALAKFLGDAQAVQKAARTGSPQPIVRRLARREAGRLTGRLLGRLFR